MCKECIDINDELQKAKAENLPANVKLWQHAKQRHRNDVRTVLAVECYEHSFAPM